MPPQQTSVPDPNEKLLPPGRPSSAGPMMGIVIILVLMVFGAFYFWGAYLNKKASSEQLPLISGDSSEPL